MHLLTKQFHTFRYSKSFEWGSMLPKIRWKSLISEQISCKVFNRIPGFWRELRNLPLTSPLCLVVADCLAGEMCCHWQHCVLSLRSTSLSFPHLSIKQFKINSLKKSEQKCSCWLFKANIFKCLKCIFGWKRAFRSLFLTTTRNFKF